MASFQDNLRGMRPMTATKLQTIGGVVATAIFVMDICIFYRDRHLAVTGAFR